MPTYRKRLIIDSQTTTPLDPLRGGAIMRRDRASAVHATGDRVLRHGRRILLRAGLHGSGGWRIADTEPGQMSLTYPDSSTERVVMRMPALNLTPGHFVRVVLIANPSGMTEAIGSVPTGAVGKVKVTAVYNNGADTSVSRTIDIVPSAEQYAAQPSGAGAAWTATYRYRSPLLLPADLSLIANLASWTDGVTVTLTLAYIGSPRVIDVVVYEEPYRLAYDLAAGDWIAPAHANGHGLNLGQLGGPVPVIKKSASDPGGGTEIILDAAARQCQELGPILLSATTWNEVRQDFDETEAEYQEVTGTSYTEIVALWSSGAYDSDKAGWSLSSGANARRVQESEAVNVMRDADNVVPVRCWIYGAMSTAAGSPTATVRFESSGEAIAEVAVAAGTSYAWHSATGHLRCGLGAQDPTVLQVRAKCSAGGGVGFRWRYIVVAFADL